MSNRTKHRVRTLALPDMPDRTVSYLAYAAAALFALYLVFVIVTVSYATVETSLTADVRTTEGSIAGLETTYYAAIARQDAETPSSLGLVAPENVLYATEKPADSLSYAGR